MVNHRTSDVGFNRSDRTSDAALIRLDRTFDVASNIGHGNQTNLGSGNSKRSPRPSKYEHHEVKGIRRLAFWATGMLLDPLVVYIFFIDGDRKCVQVDKSFGMAICIVKVVVDIVNIIFYMKLELHNDLREGARILHVCWFIVCMFPHSWLFRANTCTVWHGAMPVLFQALPRAIRLLTLSAKTIPPSASFGLWALKFFYSYLYMGQVIGAMWYFGAICTVAKCWRKACRSHNIGCTDRDFHDRDRFLRCNGSLEAYKTMIGFCSINTTEFDFGVFRDAYKSGILEMGGRLRKILYCFRWAMQEISGFGLRLEAAGTSACENFFKIFIFFVALALFVFLIRQMQVYMQSGAEREKRKAKSYK